MTTIQLPDNLVEYVAAGLCLPWCGAGISLSSGLPTWSSLVKAMMTSAASSLTEAQIAELHTLYDRSAYEDIVDYCRDSMGEGEYREFLARTVDIGHPSRVHAAVVNMPVSAVLTTNYDRLLETAAVQVKGTLPKVLTAHDSQTLWKQLARREFFILKVHGDIVRPDTLVFTSRDYTSHVFGNLPFMAFLQRLMLSHAILFIGSSLTDVYIRRILEETSYMTRGVGLPHFALLPNVGSVQTRILRDRYNIRVISYDPGPDHDHESRILEVLARLTDASAAHNLNFRKLPPLLHRRLVDLLPRMYDGPTEIQRLVAWLDLKTWTINWNRSARDIWEQTIELIVRERQLVALLEIILKDEEVKGYHPHMQDLAGDVREWELGSPKSTTDGA